MLGFAHAVHACIFHTSVLEPHAIIGGKLKNVDFRMEQMSFPTTRQLAPGVIELALSHYLSNCSLGEKLRNAGWIWLALFCSHMLICVTCGHKMPLFVWRWQ